MAQQFWIVIVLALYTADVVDANVAMWIGLHQRTRCCQSLSQSFDIQDVRLLEAVETAENQMHDNIVELPDDNNQGHAGTNLDPDSFLVKAFIGEGVNLTCSPEFPIGYSAIGFVEHLTWNHNGQPIGNNFAIDHSGFTQSHNFYYGILRIHPVTHRSAGKFECIQRCLQNPANICVRRKYVVHAIPREVHHVFLPSWNPYSFYQLQMLRSYLFPAHCRSNAFPVRIHISFGSMAECSLHHQKVIFSTAFRLYSLQIRLAYFGLRVSTITPHQFSMYVYNKCSETTTLTFLRPDYRRGNIECWARTDPTSEKWSVQTKHVY